MIQLPTSCLDTQPNTLDVAAVRDDFPILAQRPNGKPLVYVDNAATTQTPRCVLDVMRDVSMRYYANIHRGVYRFSEWTTEAYEKSRGEVQQLLNASDPREIVFVRGATEAINLVAEGIGRSDLCPGDEVIVSEMEHHANIVPWQRLRDERGARLRVLRIRDDGRLDLDHLAQLLGNRTRLVAVTHVSNALGTVNPVRQVTRMAHAAGAKVLVDGAQAVPHMHVDVRVIGCDYYVFSGHKVYGPTGIGALYGRLDQLERLPPYQVGGDMIRSVEFERTTFADVPQRFEAGTPNIIGAIGLGEAIRYVRRLGIERIRAHEQALLAYALPSLRGVPGLRIFGDAPQRAAVISFALAGAHPHDVATLLDGEGVAVRSGHHCTQPLMRRLGVAATTRASFGLYNTRAEVDVLTHSLRMAAEVLS